MSTFKLGLVSITFRKLSPREVVDLVVRAQTPAIEWGGDIHVPHGDLARAREVRQMCEDAGVASCAYGSYYRLAPEENPELPFERVLETAVALGAPVIRVWAGAKASAQVTAGERAATAARAQEIADIAQDAGVIIAWEYHANTLTDTADSALQWIRETEHPAVRTLWQPPTAMLVEEAVAGLDLVLPWVQHIHVFHWPEHGVRRPLAEGAADWKIYLDKLRTTGRDYDALLEFVEDDAPENFLRDAAALRAIIAAGS